MSILLVLQARQIMSMTRLRGTGSSWIVSIKLCCFQLVSIILGNTCLGLHMLDSGNDSSLFSYFEAERNGRYELHPNVLVLPSFSSRLQTTIRNKIFVLTRHLLVINLKHCKLNVASKNPFPSFLSLTQAPTYNSRPQTP